MHLLNRMVAAIVFSCLFPMIQPGWAMAEDQASVPLGSTTEPSPEVDRQRRQRRGDSGWSIFLGLGHRKGVHVAEDFKAGLIEGGYVDGTWGGGYWIPASYSASPTGGSDSSAMHIGLSYDPKPRLGYRLFLNSGDLVHATGRRINEDSSTHNININGSLTTVGLLVEFRPSPVIRFGAGPAYNSFTVDYVQSMDGSLAARETQTHGVFGLALEAMLTAPAHTGWFLFLGVQRHEIMDFDIGPFEGIPATPASISHSIWLFGFGLRP